MIKVGRREEGLAALTDLIWEKCFLRVRVCNLPRNALTLRSTGAQIAICDTDVRALHSRNGWGFAAGGDGDSLPDNFLAVPR